MAFKLPGLVPKQRAEQALVAYKKDPGGVGGVRNATVRVLMREEERVMRGKRDRKKKRGAHDSHLRALREDGPLGEEGSFTSEGEQGGQQVGDACEDYFSEDEDAELVEGHNERD